MHFWIDKRSQTCGFSGRHRVPSSISTGGFSGRHYRRGSGIGALGLGLCSASSARNYNCHPQAHVKLMVTPVHRFQSIECVTNNGRRYNSHRTANHRWQSSSGLHHHVSSPSNYSNHQHNSNSSRTDAQHPSSALDLDANNSGDNFLEIPSLDSVSHPRNSASEQHPHMILPTTGKLKCGMWASFAIVTVLMVGAKFYFNNQSTVMEILIFCSLLVIVLFAGCAVSLCEAVTSEPSQPLTSPIIIDTTANRLSPSPHHHNRTSAEDVEQQSQHLHPLIQINTQQQLNSSQSARNTSPTRIIDQPQPPPPYHIAVLLPQHQPNNNNNNNNQQHHIIIVDDSPPPSYDKVVIS